MRYSIILLSAVLSLASLPAKADEGGQPDKPEATGKGFFIGVQGGMPFGVSTFSSFGADRIRPGYSAGIYGGYRFNPVLSLEAAARWGRANLSAQGCCADLGYWLGSDGVRYNVPVLNMDGWNYGDLKSSVFMQNYGLQLNVNVLGFFDETRHGRWTLEVSPLLAAVGTKATVNAISDGAEAIKGSTRWHLGAGGNLQAGFQATKHLNIGVYSGLTYLTGDRMDRIPVNLHKANYVWESGIKVGFTFGRKNRKEIPGQARNDIKEKLDYVKEKPGDKESVQGNMAQDNSEGAGHGHSKDSATRHSEDDKHGDAEASSTRHPALDAGSANQIQLPTIYFAFNSTRIRHSELPKVQQIRDMMLADPAMKIEITGWADAKGGEEINAAFSVWRAQAVKACLISYGIDSKRIAIAGNGVDNKASDDAEARRVECVTVKCEEE